jgi:[NiFe] hydrogenase assembly HybE family chaperone
MSIHPADLVATFREIGEQRMQDLPIVNPRLRVEGVGFRDFDEHEIGVLITPWFMNIVLLPGTCEWNEVTQGALVSISFPSGPCELTVCQQAELDTYLAAVLFRSVLDFPDQGMAVAVAEEAMLNIMTPPTPPEGKVSRRNLLTGMGEG